MDLSEPTTLSLERVARYKAAPQSIAGMGTLPAIEGDLPSDPETLCALLSDSLIAGAMLGYSCRTRSSGGRPAVALCPINGYWRLMTEDDFRALWLRLLALGVAPMTRKSLVRAIRRASQGGKRIDSV